MPIREALQKLQGEGLVTIEPNCGACVRKIDEKFIADIYDLRGAIDAMLIRRAAARLTETDRRALEIILETHQQAERRGEFAASLEYNKQFHRVIYRVADNPDATEVIEPLLGPDRRPPPPVRVLARLHGRGRRRAS